MASDSAAVPCAPCDLCGKPADPSVEDCVALTCVARCHHPKEDDVYHCDCIKKYMRSFCRNMDVSRGSGYMCPKGRGKGTNAKQPCPSKVSHSQKIIIKTIKPSAAVPQDINNGDTAQGKAKQGKKGAGQAAAVAASAPKAKKSNLPTLNTLPRRTPITSRAPEPYLPTEVVKLPPVPEKHKKDPLGRNTAAAAAAAAKAAKKNAKRAAARQRKLEQEQGMPDGAPAAQAASGAASDAAESEDEEDEWEVWDEEAQQEAQQESWLGLGAAEPARQPRISSSSYEDDADGCRQAWERADSGAAAKTPDASALTWAAADFSSSPDYSSSSVTGGHHGAFSPHTPQEEPASVHAYDPSSSWDSAGQAPEAPAAAAPAGIPAAGAHGQSTAGFSNWGTATAAEPAAAVATYLQQQQQQHVSEHSSGLSAVAAALQSASGSQIGQPAAAQGYHVHADHTYSSTQQPAWLAHTTPAAPSAAPSTTAPYEPAMQYTAGQYNAAQQMAGMHPPPPVPLPAAGYQAPITAVPEQQQQGYGATYSTAGSSITGRVHPYMHASGTYPAAVATVPQPSAASWASQQQHAATYVPAASTGLIPTQAYQASLPAASAAYPAAAYPVATAAGGQQMPQQQYPGSGSVYGATGCAQAYMGGAAAGRGAQDAEDDNLDDLLALLGVQV